MESIGHNTKYKGEKMTAKTVSFTAKQLEWLKKNSLQALRDLIDSEIKKEAKK